MNMPRHEQCNLYLTTIATTRFQWVGKKMDDYPGSLSRSPGSAHIG